jgi:hypothetical protein
LTFHSSDGMKQRERSRHLADAVAKMIENEPCVLYLEQNYFLTGIC